MRHNPISRPSRPGRSSASPPYRRQPSPQPQANRPIGVPATIACDASFDLFPQDASQTSSHNSNRHKPRSLRFTPRPALRPQDASQTIHRALISRILYSDFFMPSQKPVAIDDLARVPTVSLPGRRQFSLRNFLPRIPLTGPNAAPARRPISTPTAFPQPAPTGDQLPILTGILPSEACALGVDHPKHEANPKAQ